MLLLAEFYLAVFNCEVVYNVFLAVSTVYAVHSAYLTFCV